MTRRDIFRIAAGAAYAGSGPMRTPATEYRPWSTLAEAPLPNWAQTGNFVFMGLDGGPLEAEKGLRSGWAGFTRDDPQGILKAVREFYRPENVQIPVTAGANWVFVTWSNGWSKDRERADQWPQAVRFIEELKRNGVHVSAYISSANMFWEDYLERVPASRKWIETRNPALIRHYGGSLYRVMANVMLPEWRNEIKIAIDTALDAGVEGFWMDNLFWFHGDALFLDFNKEMIAHARRRRPDVLWHTNVNGGIYNWARVGNVVGTEDGRVPQYTPGADSPVTGNLGLIAFIAGLKEGWRSAILENYGNGLPGVVWQLMIAECWMRGVGKTWFPSDRLLQAQLDRREPQAWKILEAMGVYNRHLLKHSEYFQEGDPLAPIGVVGHPGCSGEDIEVQTRTKQGQTELIALLDMLAGWNLQYEVLFEDRLNPTALRNFSAVVISDPDHIPDGAPEVLKAYGGQGGTLIAPSGAGYVGGRNAIELPREAFQAKGKPQMLREQLANISMRGNIRVNAPEGVVWRAVRQSHRTLVHLVNYRMQRVAPFKVSCPGPVARAEILVPESGDPRPLPLTEEGGASVAVAAEFPVHALIVFYA